MHITRWYHICQEHQDIFRGCVEMSHSEKDADDLIRVFACILIFIYNNNPSETYSLTGTIVRSLCCVSVIIFWISKEEEKQKNNIDDDSTLDMILDKRQNIRIYICMCIHRECNRQRKKKKKKKKKSSSLFRSIWHMKKKKTKTVRLMICWIEVTLLLRLVENYIDWGDKWFNSFDDKVAPLPGRRNWFVVLKCPLFMAFFTASDSDENEATVWIGLFNIDVLPESVEVSELRADDDAVFGWSAKRFICAKGNQRFGISSVVWGTKNRK